MKEVIVLEEKDLTPRGAALKQDYSEESFLKKLQYYHFNPEVMSTGEYQQAKAVVYKHHNDRLFVLKNHNGLEGIYAGNVRSFCRKNRYSYQHEEMDHDEGVIYVPYASLSKALMSLGVTMSAEVTLRDCSVKGLMFEIQFSKEYWDRKEWEAYAKEENIDYSYEILTR